MMRVYIAGPMTGYEDWNYPAFHKAAEDLRAAGHDVCNPAENFNGNTTLPRPVYLRRSIDQVMTSEAVATLLDWKNSPGARMEVLVAHELEIPVYAVACLVSSHFDKEICKTDVPSVLAYRRDREKRKKKSAPDPKPIPPELLDDWCRNCGADLPTPEDFCQSEKCKEFWAARSKVSQGLKYLKGLDNATSPKYEAPDIDPNPFGDEAGDFKIPVRAYTLDEAKRLVMGDRNAQYGPPTQDFERTASVLTDLGYRVERGGHHALKPSDVSVIMIALKLSRLMHSRDKQDSWVDVAGYAACGAECAKEADEL